MVAIYIDTDVISLWFCRWIVRIHQHDTLLEDREEEKLTLEEQDLAWEKFKRITENTGADWMDGDLGPNPTYVQNSYANPVEMGERSSCSTKLHAELLVNSDVKNNMYVKCDSCEQMIGWEHIVKGRAFIPRKK
jgi:transcriptional regulator ATRX